MSTMPALRGEGATHVGTVRSRNEDAFLVRDDLGLWAVADGAGGHGAGDVAAREAIAALSTIPPGLTAPEVLAQVRLRLQAVHRDLRARAEAENGPGAVMASTVVVLIARAGHCAFLWAGDSRGYLLRDGTLSRVTRDHSLVQELVDSGALDEAAAEGHPQANVVTRALGAGPELVLDKAVMPAVPGDVYLLCSDGLTKALRDDAIGDALRGGVAADALVERAVAVQARDNVTGVVVRGEQDCPSGSLPGTTPP